MSDGNDTMETNAEKSSGDNNQNNHNSPEFNFRHVLETYESEEKPDPSLKTIRSTHFVRRNICLMTDES